MTVFRNTLIVMTLLIVVVTLAAVANGGLNLITPFVSEIIALSWQGQFNVDFACYLVLSGIWMAWRSGFTRTGMALGILAPPFGILFLAPYLIYLIRRCEGDPKVFLLGTHAKTA